MTEPAPPPGADPIEAEVMRIWAEIGLRPASLDDDFFAIGGQSLTLVRFLARVQETFGVELPVDRLFDTDLTVAVAARLITQVQLDGAADDDLAAVLAEVEGLSEDELAALLAEAE